MFYDIGEIVSEADALALMDARSRALHRACVEHQHFEVLSLQRVGTSEAIATVVDAGDGSVAPGNVAGIHRRERLAIYFTGGDDSRLEVRALRREFPDVLHLNGVAAGEPKSLCLLQLDDDTIERRYSAEQLLTRVLEWLELTAEDKLHQDEQGLEQVFYTTGTLVLLPADVVELRQQPSRTLSLASCRELNGQHVIELTFAGQGGGQQGNLRLQPLAIVVSPATQGPIRRQPHYIGDLHEALGHLGSGVINPLREVVREAATGGSMPSANSDVLRVLLIVLIPRAKAPGDPVSRWDKVGYVLDADLAALGLALGVLHSATPGGKAFPIRLIGDSATEIGGEDWKRIGVAAVDVRRHTTHEAARAMAGIDREDGNFCGVLAGVGALGSALADYWARSGWGRWHYIDPDIIEPHNIVRHLARREHVGLAKVEVVRELTNHVYGLGSDDAKSLHARAERVDDGQVRRLLDDADLLVDASTTLAVPREWAAVNGLPRSASVFLTPSGRGSALLLEDKQREIRADALEAQYYRALIQQEWGVGQLASAEAIRAGAGCRDRSVVMPVDQVQLHAALLSRRLRVKASGPRACIEVWAADSDGGAVAFHEVDVHPVKRARAGDWTIKWDTGLVAQLGEMRHSELPNETGGVLFGVTDQKLRTIHLVCASAAPEGSIATPAGFVRAPDGVEALRERIQHRTGMMVDYVGEWHSHPDGVGARPSGDDIALINSLAHRLNADGLPAVMVIVGDRELAVALQSGGVLFKEKQVLSGQDL